MTINEARMIREIKRRCTYRRLAEIYYPEKSNGHGNQMFGQDLCREACDTLGIDWQRPYDARRKKFNAVNQSYLGKFYWWE